MEARLSKKFRFYLKSSEAPEADVHMVVYDQVEKSEGW